MAPILASLNIPIAKMSGRGLGITGGTIDKLESIPGYNINLNKEDYVNNVNKCNISIGSQTDKIVPLDKVIYALRDVTGTTESIPLIASSIMSKKIACGAKYIIIDIKCGEGALIKDINQANLLSDWLVKIGTSYKINVKTIITNMDEPLSNAIGNSIEVLEVIDILKGKKTKLLDVSLELASNLISMYENINTDEALYKAKEVVNNGLAYQSFVKWITTQGGNLDAIKVSNNIYQLKSNKDGIINNISSYKCGKLVLKLGAGRLTKNDKIDYGVGIKLLKRSGDYIKKGDILALIYTNDKIKLNLDDINIFMINDK